VGSLAAAAAAPSDFAVSPKLTAGMETNMGTLNLTTTEWVFGKPGDSVYANHHGRSFETVFDSRSLRRRLRLAACGLPRRAAAGKASPSYLVTESSEIQRCKSCES
jgi:hypothetical protein